MSLEATSRKIGNAIGIAQARIEIVCRQIGPILEKPIFEHGLTLFSARTARIPTDKGKDARRLRKPIDLSTLRSFLPEDYSASQLNSLMHTQDLFEEMGFHFPISPIEERGRMKIPEEGKYGEYGRFSLNYHGKPYKGRVEVIGWVGRDGAPEYKVYRDKIPYKDDKKERNRLYEIIASHLEPGLEGEEPPFILSRYPDKGEVRIALPKSKWSDYRFTVGDINPVGVAFIRSSLDPNQDEGDVEFLAAPSKPISESRR